MKKWKFVFGLMLVLFIIQVIAVPLGEDQSISNLIGLIFGGLSIIPLYGYAYGVAIGSKVIAIAIFSINALAAVFGVIALILAVVEYFGVVQIIASGLGLLFLWAFMYPQYAYAFRSNELWRVNA